MRDAHSLVFAAVLTAAVLSTTLAAAQEAVGARFRGVMPPGRIAVVAAAPDLAAGEPLSEPAWAAGEDLGPLCSVGVPEGADARTRARLLLCGNTLYFGAECASPGGGDPAGDSLRLILTQNGSEGYPYYVFILPRAGVATAARYTKPFFYWKKYPPVEPVDLRVLTVRTGEADGGWWAVCAIPLDTLGIRLDGLMGNVVRGGAAEAPVYAWSDFDGRWSRAASRLAPLVASAAPLSPRPALRMPAQVTVGVSPLKFDAWRSGIGVGLSGAACLQREGGPAEIFVRGQSRVELELLEGGEVHARYEAHVGAPLVIEMAEPFVEDVGAPVRVEARLTAAVTEPVEVAFTGMQDGREVSLGSAKLVQGEQTVELPSAGLGAGEVRVFARGSLDCGVHGTVDLEAEHLQMRGARADDYDRFREGIEKLEPVERWRAGLADAAAFYRLLQGGDGAYRAMGGRGLRGSEWFAGMCWPMALVYKADWPENPYRGDERFLRSAVAGLDAGLDPSTEYRAGGYSRALQAHLQTYALLKDDVPAEKRTQWRERLVELVEHVMETYLIPAEHLNQFYSEDIGTGTNHFAYYVMNVYTGGRVLDRPEWTERAGALMLRLAGHEAHGQFPERRDVPTTQYTWLTMNGLGEYYVQSGDERVRPNVERCAEWAIATTLPSLDIITLHNGRTNHRDPWWYGDFVLSMTPRGRRLERLRIDSAINSSRKPSQMNPEFWFRAAENALYSVAGPEEEIWQDGEFAFYGGKGLIARQRGFVYGLSGISVKPVNEEFLLDAQNAIEMHHAAAGAILHGANSQAQPEAGTFFSPVEGGAWLPIDGVIERTGDGLGHDVTLDYGTFVARVTVRVLSDSEAEVRAEVVEKRADVPVVFNFFPGAGDNDLMVTDSRLLSLRSVIIRCNQRLQIEEGFRITDAYSLRRTVDTKPVRAFLPLEMGRPAVLGIEVRERVGEGGSR